MTASDPYLSVIVTSRNDDHGGSLMRRMQTFVTCFINQCVRHGIHAELLIVEWNPPTDRPPLVEALVWPSDFGPCSVRLIQVPEELHEQYAYSKNLPLFQMIAKNVGIRRARGEFLLITNIDILLSDELCQFLAQRQLRKGILYRIDRTDVDTDVPVFAPVEEQLDYCRTHHLRNNAKLGTIPLNSDGTVWTGTIPEGGLQLGEGWCPIEFERDESFLWATDAGAEVILPPGSGEGHPYLWLDLQVGPSAGWGRLTLRVVDQSGTEIATVPVLSRQIVCIRVPEHSRPGVLRLIADGPLRHRPGEARILPFRLFKARWVDRYETRIATEDEKLIRSPGVRLVDGWDRPIEDRGEWYVWARGPAELEVTAEGGPFLALDLQAGPSAGWMRFQLTALGPDGEELWSGSVYQRQSICIPLPANGGLIRLIPTGADRPIPRDPRGFLPFRLWQVARLDHHDDRHFSADDQVLNASGVHLRDGWRPAIPDAPSPEWFIWATGPAQLEVSRIEARFLVVDIQSGISAEWKRFPLRVIGPEGEELLNRSVLARQVISIPAPRTPGILRFLPEGCDVPVPDDPVSRLPFRIFDVRWSDEEQYRPSHGDEKLVHASGVRLLDGWDRVVPEHGEYYIFALGSAGLEVRAHGGKYLWLDIQAGPSADWRVFQLLIRDSNGRLLLRFPVAQRQVLCIPMEGLPEILRLETEGADQLVPHDPRERLPFRIYGIRWTDRLEYRPRLPDGRCPDDELITGPGLRLGSGWDLVERDPPPKAEAYIWARGPADIEVGDAASRYLCLDLQAGPSADWRQVHLRILDESGSELGQYLIVGRQVISLLVPPGKRLLRLEPQGADRLIPNDHRQKLPFRIYGAWGSDRYHPRPAGDNAVIHSDGVWLLDGWDLVTSEGDEQFVWAKGAAELELAAGVGGYLQLDLQPGPSADWGPFVLRVLDRQGRELTRQHVTQRQIICFPVPQEGGFIRLEPEGADRLLPDSPHGRLPFRVYGFRRTTRYDPRPWNPDGPSPDSEVLHAEGVRLLDGWGRVERSAEGFSIPAFGPAALEIDGERADSANRALALTIEPVAPSLVALEIVDPEGRVAGRGSLVGRTIVTLDCLWLAGRSARVRIVPVGVDQSGSEVLFRLLDAGWVPGTSAEQAPLTVRQSGGLGNRVRSLFRRRAVAAPTWSVRAEPAPCPASVTSQPRQEPPAAQPSVAEPLPETRKDRSATRPATPLPDQDPLYYDPEPVVVPPCVAEARVPYGAVAPPLLHLNACGDFHLLAREHCFEIRGYAEFPIYSLHIDSLFSYTLSAAGIEEEILPPPMYAYHIEHAKGTGATPEGIGLLLERMRKRGIPVLEWEQVSNWGIEMVNARGPILFNDETWGLAGVPLPEMSPHPRSE